MPKTVISTHLASPNAYVKRTMRFIGKAEKQPNQVFLDPQTYSLLLRRIPQLAKFISVSTVMERCHVVGSVARQLLDKCTEMGCLRCIEKHHGQTIYTQDSQLAHIQKDKEAKERRMRKK